MESSTKDATGQTNVANSYDEAIKSVAARRGAEIGTGFPMPDTPTGSIHLNPALTPAPPRIETPERIPVPVINDPGVVGANPSLADLNRQNRLDALGHDSEYVGGASGASIKAAAQARQETIADKVEAATGAAVTAAEAPKEPPPEPGDH